MPKLIYRLGRTAAAAPETLPVVTDATVIPANTTLVAHLAGGPQRMTLLRTAALLSANGYAVTAPAGGSASATAPGQVTGLGLIGQVYNGAASLSWTATPNTTSYKVERRAAGTTTYVLLATVSTASASVSGLPYETTQEIRVTASNAAGSGPPSAVLSVAVPAYVAPTAGDGSSAITGTGLALKIKAQKAFAAGSPMTHGHAFAPGEFPAGTRLVMRVAGTGGVNVPVQTDQHSTWPDGSVRMCSLSYLAHGNTSAGQVVEFRITREVGTEDRTPVITAAALAASTDIRLKQYGLDLAGSEDLHTSVKQILTNGPLHNATTGWGDTPSMGYEVIRQGRIVSEYLVWAVPRTVAGALHRWLKNEIYVRVWAGGFREITPHIKQPWAYQAFPGATIGPAVQDRVACCVELFDGAQDNSGTLLYAYAGHNSPQSFTVPTSVFRKGNPGTEGNANYIQLLDNAENHWGRGSAVTLAGDLPTGLNGNTTYFPFDYLDAPFVAFTTLVAHARSGGPDGEGGQDKSSQISWTGTPATGTIRISPAAHTYAACGLPLMLPNAQPFWQGPSARPEFTVEFDEVHLTTKTKAVPPYDLTVSRPQRSLSAAPKPYHLGSVTWRMTDHDRGSDDADVNHIGYLPVDHAAMILLPHDHVRDQKVRALALKFGHFNILAEDHRSSRPVVSINGTYPANAPANPSFRLYHGTNSVNTGAPGWGGYQAWRKRDAETGDPGYRTSYDVPMDGAHQPEMMLVPYLRTGHHIYAAMGANVAMFSHQGATDRSRTFNGTTYDGLVTNTDGNNNARFRAWVTRTLGNAEVFIPDAHPTRHVLKAILDSNASYVGAQAPTTPHAHLGVQTEAWCAMWMQSLHQLVIGMEAWRGTRPGWLSALKIWSRFAIGALGDDGPVTNGSYCCYIISRVTNDGPNGPWPTQAAMMSQFSDKKAFEPTGYFPTGIPEAPGQRDLVEGHYTGVNAYPYIHRANLRMLQRLHLDGLGDGAFVDAGKVYGQQHTRALNFNRIEPFIDANDPDKAFPHWAISNPAPS